VASGLDKSERAFYVLCVRGSLVPDLATWFPEFSVTCGPSGDTVLSGEVIDRAAFYAILSRARDLGLTLISVERRE
jgi:hypothetical protein